MTDPTTKTVRGWQVALLEALGSLGTSPELLAEIRYLNQGLFGSTAQTPAINPPNALLGELFTAERLNGSSANPETVGIAKLLIAQGGDYNRFDVSSLLDAIRGDLNYVSSQQIGRANNQTLAQTAFETFGQVDTIRGYLNSPSGSAATLLLDILSAIGKMGQNGGPYTAREWLARIAEATLRSAECCEEGGGGGEPAVPDPVASSCSGFTPDGGEVDFGALDFSVEFEQNGMSGVVTGATLEFNDFQGSLPGDALKNTGAGTVFYIAVLTKHVDDVGEYFLTVQNFTPAGAVSDGPSDAYDVLLMPENNCVVSDFRVLDFSNVEVRYYFTLARLEGGDPVPYAGPAPKLKLFTGNSAS